MSTTTTGRNDGHLAAHVRQKFSGERCTDFDDLLDQALADKQVHTLDTMPGADGAPVPITTMDEAKILKNRIYACKPARRTHSVVMSEQGLGIVQLGPDRWGFRFRVEPKDTGRGIIAGKAERGEQLAYNVAERQPRKPRRQAAREAREAAQRAQELADRREYLERRLPGEDWTDPRNWQVDHGLAEPRTNRERANEDHARKLGVQAERREQQRIAELREFEAEQQQAGGSVAREVLSWFR